MKILFVCHGNICRSAMAEYMFKKMVKDNCLEKEFPLIESAAVSTEELGNPVYPPARAELALHGITCQGHRARQITRSDYDRFDRIYVMDRMNLRLIRGILGQERMDKVSMLLDHDIADPWYTDNFNNTYTDLLQGLTAIIKK